MQLSFGPFQASPKNDVHADVDKATYVIGPNRKEGPLDGAGHGTNPTPTDKIKVLHYDLRKMPDNSWQFINRTTQGINQINISVKSEHETLREAFDALKGFIKSEQTIGRYFQRAVKDGTFNWSKSDNTAGKVSYTAVKNAFDNMDKPAQTKQAAPSIEVMNATTSFSP